MPNLIEQMNVLKGLSDEALNGEMGAPSGSVPPYLVLSEVNRRKDMRQRYEGQQAQRAKRTTVMEDLLPPGMNPAMMGGMMGGGMGQAMPTPSGIGAAVQPEVPGFADGGIIDYADISRKYQDRLNSLPEARERARAMALLKAGAAMMGGGSSNTLRNIGIGANAGIDSYAQALTAVDSEESDLLRDLISLDSNSRQAASSGAESYFAPIAGTSGGKPTFIQFGNRGGVRQADGLPEDFVPQSRYEKIDAGDHWILIDTTTGERTTQVKQGAPGTNYNVEGEGPDRVVIPAPGSVEAIERAELDAKRGQVADQTAQTADVVTTDIDRALGAIEANPAVTTGWGALFTQDLGAGPAADVKRLIETVKANVSFDKLQQMRASSPTGAALGPVSDFENRLLQATIGNLELAQNAEQLKQNLERVKEIYTAIVTKGIKDPSAPGGPAIPVKSGTVGNVQFTVEPD